MTQKKSTTRKTQASVAKSERDIFLDSLFVSSEIVSAQALADALDVHAKSLRGMMRSNKLRDQSEFKNAEWKITRDLATRVYDLRHKVKQSEIAS